jgi:hypothetical protein
MAEEESGTLAFYRGLIGKPECRMTDTMLFVRLRYADNRFMVLYHN